MVAGVSFGQGYEIIELETLGGVNTAFDVNEAGHAVGRAIDGSGLRHAVLWANGSITDLGTLGGAEGVANAINDSGQVVGWAFNESGNERGFLWATGTMLSGQPWQAIPNKHIRSK